MSPRSKILSRRDSGPGSRCKVFSTSLGARTSTSTSADSGRLIESRLDSLRHSRASASPSPHAPF
eukprot:1783039-Pyramimonas_sp.AAC.1